MTVDDSHPPKPERRWYHFSVRTLLAVTAITALVLVMTTRAGTLEAVLFGVIGIPLLIVAVCAWNQWPWLIGFVILLALAVAATPPDPLSMLVFAIPACVVYGLAVLAWKAKRKRTPER